MAQPTSTVATNDMIGIREDLSDVIYNVAPYETPFLSSAAHVAATSTTHEWMTDTLNAASATNAAIEGDDAPQTAGTFTTRLTNLTQISTKDARVTGTGQAVTTAGRADELDYQLLKRGNELKTDVESALLANKIKVTGNDTLGRELAGIGAWIATNTSFDATSGTDPTAADGTDARNDSSAVRVLTETLLKDVLLQAWTAGGHPDTLSFGGFNRQKASTFTGNATAMSKSEDTTLHATYSMYESDFGTVKIVPNRFQRARDGLVLDMDMWAVAYLPGRNMTSFDIAKTGDSDAKQILCEYTLESRNEKSSGIIADLTTS